MSDRDKYIVIGAVAALLLIILGVLLFTGVFAGGGMDREEERRLNTLALARDYMERGEYESALRLLDDLLIEDSDDADAESLRAEVLLVRAGGGEGGEAGEGGAAGAKGAAGAVGGEAAFGEVLDNEGLLAEASAEEGGLGGGVDPAQAEAARKARKEKEARRLALEKEVGALLERGRGALNEGRYDDAWVEAVKALGLLPGSRAAAVLKRDAEAARRNAESEAQRRKREEKERRLRQLLDEAEALIDGGEYAQARKNLAEARKIDSSSGRAWFLEGESWFKAAEVAGRSSVGKASDRGKARKAFEEALKRNPRDWLSFYRLGQMEADEGRFKEAVDFFEKAAAINRDSAELWFDLGKAQYRIRFFREASESFGKASSLKPTLRNVWFNLGLSLNRSASPGRAAAAFEASVDYQPDHSASHYELGRSFMAGKRWPAAAAALTMAANLSPRKAAYWRSLAAAYFNDGRKAAASSAYERALEIAPRDGDTLHNLAIIHLELGNGNEAFERAAAAVKTDNSNAVYLYTMGQAAEMVNLTEQAIEVYGKSAALDTGYVKPRINLGVIYDERGDYNRALEYLRQALRIESDSTIVWNNLGKTYLHMKDYENSLSFFERASRAEPGDVEIKMNLALALTESGEKSRAISAYKDVLALSPGLGEAYDKLARLQFGLGLEEEALNTVALLRRRASGYKGIADLEALIQ